MLPFYKKYWRTAFDIALIALTVFLIMYVFSFLYRIATPIFFSFVIFLCIEPLARRLHRMGMKKSIASGISVLVFTVIILGVLSGAALLIIQQGSNLVENFPKYQKMLMEQIAFITQEVQQRMGNMPVQLDLVERSQELIGGATATLSNVGKNIFSHVVTYVSSVSSFIFNFVVGIILAYFLSIEITTWKQTAEDKTPNTFKKAFFFLRNNVFKGIALYIKAQAKMISITFVVILVALMLLGVDNAFVIAVVSAIFDILPLLGVGTIFIPWIIYLIIVGKISLAIWLSALFLAVVLTRQILEPKITGDSLGVSAFTMLAFMIVSLSLFGVAGVILSPILMILIKALYDQGYFHRWIHAPVGEFDAPAAPLAGHSSEAEAEAGDTKPSR